MNCYGGRCVFALTEHSGKISHDNHRCELSVEDTKCEGREMTKEVTVSCERSDRAGGCKTPYEEAQSTAKMIGLIYGQKLTRKQIDKLWSTFHPDCKSFSSTVHKYCRQLYKDVAPVKAKEVKRSFTRSRKEAIKNGDFSSYGDPFARTTEGKAGALLDMVSHVFYHEANSVLESIMGITLESLIYEFVHLMELTRLVPLTRETKHIYVWFGMKVVGLSTRFKISVSVLERIVDTLLPRSTETEGLWSEDGKATEYCYLGRMAMASGLEQAALAIENVEDWFKGFLHGPAFKVAIDFMSSLAAYGSVSTEIVRGFTSYMGPLRPVGKLEAVGLLFKSVSFMIRFGSTVLRGKNVSSFVVRDTHFNKVVLISKNLIADSHNIYAVVPIEGMRHISVVGRELSDCIGYFNEYLKIPGDLSNETMREIARQQIRSLIDLKREVADRFSYSRITPYCLYLRGPPGIGKSELVVLDKMVYAFVVGTAYSDALTFNLPKMSEYMTGYDPLVHTIFYLSELGAMDGELAKRQGDSRLELLLSLVSSDVMVANMAEADKKGKIKMQPQLVIADGNSESFNADKVLSCPSAGLRRPVYHEAVVLPEYRGSDGVSLDPKKCMDDPNVENHFQRHMHTVKRYIPSGTKGRWHTVKANMTTKEYVAWLAEDMREHFSRQLTRIAKQTSPKAVEAVFKLARNDPIDLSPKSVGPVSVDFSHLGLSKDLDDSVVKELGIVVEEEKSTTMTHTYTDEEFHLPSYLYPTETEGKSHGVLFWGYQKALVNSPNMTFREYCEFHGVTRLEFTPSEMEMDCVNCLIESLENSDIEIVLVPEPDACELSEEDDESLLETDEEKDLYSYKTEVPQTHHHLPPVRSVFDDPTPAEQRKGLEIAAMLDAESRRRQAVKKVESVSPSQLLWILNLLKVIWITLRFGLVTVFKMVKLYMEMALLAVGISEEVFWIIPPCLGYMSFYMIKTALLFFLIVVMLVLVRHDSPAAVTKSHKIHQMGKHFLRQVKVPMGNGFLSNSLPYIGVAALSFYTLGMAVSYFALKKRKWTGTVESLLEFHARPRAIPLGGTPGLFSWLRKTSKPPIVNHSQRGKEAMEVVHKNVYSFKTPLGLQGHLCFVFGNFALTSEHLARRWSDNQELELTRKSNGKVTKQVCQKWERIGTDMALCYIPGIQGADIQSWFRSGLTEEMCEVVNPGEAALRYPSICVPRKGLQATDVGGMIEYPLTLAYATSAKQEGLCGYPYICEVPAGCYIVGLHCAGDGDFGYVNPVSIEMINACVSNWKGFYASSEGAVCIPDVGPINDKSTFSFNQFNESVELLGYDGKFPGLGRSSMRKTLISTFVEEMIVDEGFEIPDKLPAVPCKGYYKRGGEKVYLDPYAASLHKISSRRYLDYDKVQDLSNRYAAFVEEKLRRRGVTKLEPLTLREAINGSDTNAYIRRMDLSTAAGYGTPGKKREYFDRVDGIDWPKPALLAEIEKCHEAYKRGETIQPIFTANLKDELVSKKKVEIGASRVFYAIPLVYFIIQRMYLTPLYCLMNKFSEVFMCAIGIDCHRDGWKIRARYQHILNKRFNDFDYSRFDLSMPVDIGLGAAYFTYRLLESFGYEAWMLVVVRGILSDSLLVYVSYLGDIVRILALQPSGKNGTAEDNSIRGIIMILFFIEEKGDPFESVIHMFVIFVYGDDVFMVTERSFRFSGAEYAAFVREVYGMGCTSATKGEASDETPFEEISFLKRLFKQHPWLPEHYWAMPLVHESIWKSFMMNVPSAYESEAEQIRGCLFSSFRELFLWYPEQKWVHLTQRLTMCYTKAYGVDLSSSLPTYQDIYTDLISNRQQ